MTARLFRSFKPLQRLGDLGFASLCFLALLFFFLDHFLGRPRDEVWIAKFGIDAGDIGTKGGLLTDQFARVLRGDGQPIPGLYATGNTSAAVMGPSYPGAGSTLGPAMTFGYIAVHHLAGV